MDEMTHWIVVVAGNNRYCGKVLMNKEEILSHITMNSALELVDAFELPFPAQIGPQGFAKIPIAVPVDLTVDPVTLWLTRISSLYFVSDLSTNDRELIQQLRKNLEEGLKRQRAERSGLVLPK